MSEDNTSRLDAAIRTHMRKHGKYATIQAAPTTAPLKDAADKLDEAIDLSTVDPAPFGPKENPDVPKRTSLLSTVVQYPEPDVNGLKAPPPPDSSLAKGEREKQRLDIQQQKLQKRAELLQAADDRRLARQQAAEEKAKREAEADAEEERQNAIDRAWSTANDVADTARASVQPAIDRISSLPTVGGIMMPLAILAILLFTVVVVNQNKDTRLKQLWYMLNGQATLQGRQTVTGTVGGGGGGTFGTTPSEVPPTGSTTGSGSTQQFATIVPSSNDLLSFRDSNVGF